MEAVVIVIGEGARAIATRVVLRAQTLENPPADTRGR